jgi:hypothetical protein
MRSYVGRIGWAAISASLCMLPTGAVAADRMVQFAQNRSDSRQWPIEPGSSPAIDAPASLPANSPEQIRKAQIELQRLECLKGRIDGKLGDQTRQAVQKFWASAKQPAVEVSITDELIADLAARGDLFCRPVRRFFGFGGRSGGNSARMPFFMPGARPGPVPPTPAPPLSPAEEH